MSIALASLPSSPSAAGEPVFATVAAAAAWARVPVAERALAQQRLAWCQRIAAAPHSRRGALVQRCADAMTVSVSAVNTWLGKFRAASHSDAAQLMALVRKCRVPVPDALNETFLSYWRGLQCGFQRGNVIKQAHRALINRWNSWRKGLPDSEIPGYETCPEPAPFTDLPPGWSYENLRRYKPNTYVNTLLKQGPAAASALAPKVRFDRAAVKPGEVVFFDDHWGDHLVIHPGDGSRKAVRPVGFFALDYNSGCAVHHWWKARSYDRAKQKHTLLSADDFIWFYLHHLTRHGVRMDTGTVLVVEHGTAAISDLQEAALEKVFSLLHDGTARAFGSLLTVDRSGRFGKPLEGLLFPGQGRGNFRVKAPLESWFNALENRGSAIIGQSGRNPDEKPEEQYGLLMAAAAYLKLLESDKLSPERKMLLRAPVLSFTEYMHVSTDIVRALNTRRDHSLTSWRECGYVQSAYQFAGEWLPLEKILALPESTQREVFTLAAHMPDRVREVQLSPQEVWKAGTARGMRRLTGPELATLVPQHLLRECRVTNSQEIVITDDSLGGEPLYFIASARDHDGHRIELKRGEVYHVILNPHDWRTIEVLHASGPRKGAWIGTCHEQPRRSVRDVEGLARSFAEVTAAVHAQRLEAEHYARATAIQRNTNATWNKKVKDTGTPLTPAEHEAAALAHTATAALMANDAAALPAHEAAEAEAEEAATLATLLQAHAATFDEAPDGDDSLS